MIREKIKKIIEAYNKYRKPEASAKLAKLKGNMLEIEFSGSFCRTCGVKDYFDDFVVEAEKYLKLKIIKTKELNKESYLVKFKILKNGK